MTDRSILIITPFFAPQTHAAVFRAYKLAKYLPQYGWKVRVVTTDINYLYNEDDGLLDALPDDVEIYRTRYIEPSIRGVRMALGGKDRTFKAIKSAILESNAAEHTVDTNNTGASEEPQLGIPRRLYSYILKNWIVSPDAHWTWERPTVQKAIELVKQHNIPLVFTSADPFTSHRIGYQIKQNTDVQWVSDLRDPHTHSYWMHSHNPRIYNRQIQAEKLTIDHADAITTAGESIALILTETYGLDNNHPIYSIPTGLDEQLLERNVDVQLPTYPYFVFVGEFLEGYGDQFFRVFAQALQNEKVKATGIKAVFIGRKDVNGPRLAPYVQKHNLQDYVEVVDHVPQETLYAYIQQSKGTLLVPGRRAGWWRLYAKLIDYIALRKPIVAIVPETSEARTHLNKSGLGVFLDGDENTAVKALSDFILSSETSMEINTAYCDRFLAQSQVKSFIGVFEQLIQQ